MRTNIEINDKLMKSAMKTLGKKTKRETVEEALRRVVDLGKQTEIKKLFGKVRWEGNLDEMRQNRW
ncbi:MAG: type II toxin-antitoxin system VapB family antitoxin [Ignavibacteriaceae bacterium]|jgi:Arc/MetJ family transcription regulator